MQSTNGRQKTSAATLLRGELSPLRQALYRLFGAMFLYPSSPTRMSMLCACARALGQEDELWKAYDAGGSLPRMLEALSGQCVQTGAEMEAEYNRLFQVKPAAPPYESYYLDEEGQARAWIAGQLEYDYAQAGRAPSPSLNDLPDHIAVELEFMSYLCGEEAHAWETNDLQTVTKMGELQCTFLDQHLGRWFPQFARRTKDAGPKELYNGLIDTAYVFLRREMYLVQLHPGVRVS